MSLANLPRKEAMRSSVIGVLMGLGFALYVYRISLGDVNITILRFTMLFLAGCLIWQIFRSKIRMLRAHWLLIVGVAVLVYVNAFWYFGLDNYPIPKREIVSHVFNLILMLGIAIWINTEQQFIRIINGYLLAAIVAIFIGYFGLFFKEIPFEDLLRAYGSAAAENMPYIIEDGDFMRLSGPFMDPNFFGVYLLSVFTFSIWIFCFRNGNLIYLLVAIASLVTLPLTMSRTAVVGLVVFFGVSVLWLPNKFRGFVIILSLILALLGIFMISIFAGSFFDRMLDSESLFERIRFISTGTSAFMENPFFGAGPAGIVDEGTGIATAHLMYLSVLAKFGVVGAIPYFCFIFFPLCKILISAKSFSRDYRCLVIGLYCPLFIMYFLYDFLFFLEFQYFIFAVGYSVVFSSFARKVQPISSEPFDESRCHLNRHVGFGGAR